MSCERLYDRSSLWMVVSFVISLLAASPAFAASLAPAAAAAVEQMNSLAGGAVEVTASPSTELVTFMATGAGNEIPLVASASAAPEVRAREFLAQFGAAFGVEADQVELGRVQGPDEVGMEHVRFQQVYRGVPVTGGELTVHLRGASVAAVNAKTVAVIEGTGVIPTLSAWQAESQVRQVMSEQAGVTAAELSPPQLEIFNRGLLEGARYPTRLAWFIEATGPGLRDFLWVDAASGAILLRFSQLTDDLARQVYDAESGSVLPGTLERSEGEPPTGDIDVDLAYEYSGDTWEYFFGTHGRDSYDNAGSNLISTVDFCPDPTSCPFQDAFWNGVQVVFGAGYPYADDKVAHEFTHGVVEHSANLYYYMQSGALNESYADIFGEVVDLTNAQGNDIESVRWQHGEDLPWGPNRDMMNPPAFNQPGKMSDSEFACSWAGTDAGGVHTNSGVPNHAFALMTDGGSYNGYSFPGMGLEKAAKIHYRALNHYLLSASDFLDNYNALKQACEDLIGTEGITAANCLDMGEALDSVEMAEPWPCDPPQYPDPVLCPFGGSPRDLFLDDLEHSASGTWTTSTAVGLNHWVGGMGDSGLYFDDFATSGSLHFWGADSDVVGDSSVEMLYDVEIAPGAAGLGAWMAFNHSYSFESHLYNTLHYDGGLLEYSTNGGVTWQYTDLLLPVGYGSTGYRGWIYESTDNPLAGRWAFVGDSFGYVTTRLDLRSLAGQNVRFRFRMGTNSGGADYGWFIDDVRIYECGVLYEQTYNRSSWGYNSQEYEPALAHYDTMAADDFVVPAAEAPWGVSGVLVTGFYSVGGGPTPLLNVQIMSNEADLPGSPICTYTGLVAGTDFIEYQGTDSRVLRIDLASPCSLPAGSYWLMVLADMDTESWFWQGQVTEHNLPFVIQNPGDGWGSGCTTWTPVSECGGAYDPGLVFALWSEPVESVECHRLTLSHLGSGADPVASPRSSPDCPAGTYESGEVIELSASPDPGWEMEGWSDTDDDLSTSRINTLTMPAADWEATARYASGICRPLTRDHTGSGEHPTAMPSSSLGCGEDEYFAGEPILLTGRPDVGWGVGSWSGTDDDTANLIANAVSMPAEAHTAVAHYVALPAGCHRLFLGHTGEGADPSALPQSSDGCPGGGYAAGTSIELAAGPPASGWTVGGWSGTEDNSSFKWTNSLLMPASDHTATVRYLTPMLVKDICPDAGDSTPEEFAYLGSTLFFAAMDCAHGVELWKSDGTEAGTVMVKDIRSGPGSMPEQLMTVGDLLFFVASEGRHGAELWKSDGTEAGTVMVKDIRPTPDYRGSDIGGITVVGDRLFFSANDGVHGSELWTSDGTEAGTVMVRDIFVGEDPSWPYDLTAFNGEVFFGAQDYDHWNELWKSDGTEAGTVMVKDIAEGFWDGSFPGGFAESGGELFFSALETGLPDSRGRELWKTNGTTAGTVLVRDLASGRTSSLPVFLTDLEGTLLYAARFGDANAGTWVGYELGRSDGSEAGTVMVKDIWPRFDGSLPGLLTRVDETLFFTANTPDQGGLGTKELWKSDGTLTGTVMVDTYPGPNPVDYFPQNLTEVEGTLFFTANDGVHGEELWQTDGTDAGTLRIDDIHPGGLSSRPEWLINAGGKFFFSADDGVHGRELWVLADPPICHSLTLSHTGSGSDPAADPIGSASCNPGEYHSGEVVTLTASPDAGWHVHNWSGTDDDASTSTVNIVTMPGAAHTVTVHYLQTCYGLTLGHTGQGSDPLADPASSSGCGPGEYHSGETVTLTASPDPGWEVSSWSGTADDASTSTVNSLVMPSGAHVAGVAYVEVVGIPDHLVMEDETMSGEHVYEACISITAGPGVEIASGALITFRAPTITLKSGFWVNADAEFIADSSYPSGCS